MMKKFAKGIFWVISLIIFIGMCITLFRGNNIFQNAFNSLLLLPFAIVVNPLCMDKILKKFGVEEANYYAFKMLCMFGGVLIAYIIAVLIFLNNEVDEKLAVQYFESILKIIIYIVYLIVIFIFKDNDKRLKYMIFGLIYCFCILLSFASQPINEKIIYFLNIITQDNLDLDSFELLKNDILIPIKEAILTFIIFETVIEKRDNKMVMRDEYAIDRKGAKENNIHNEVQCCEIKVSDNNSGKSMNYKMNIYKR